MSESIVKIRVRLGANEAEIEAPLSSIKEAIHLVPEVVQHLPKSVSLPLQTNTGSRIQFKEKSEISKILPEIKVEKEDSLPNVIVKFFQESWGRKPHKLNDIRDVLESYGLIYPKQSVAVALLRLAKDGKLRRFKDESNEYVYTASTSLAVSNPPTPPKNIEVTDKGVIIG